MQDAYNVQVNGGLATSLYYFYCFIKISSRSIRRLKDMRHMVPMAHMGPMEPMAIAHINRMRLKNKLHVVCIVWTTMYYVYWRWWFVRTTVVMICMDYDCDDLYGLWLWWFAWTIVVMIYMDYGCEFLFLWIWTSILCMCKCYINIWYIPSAMIFTKLRWNAAKIFNFPKSYGVYRLKTTVTGR